MPLSIRYTDHQAKRLIYWLIALECGFAVTYLVIHILNPGVSWGPLRPLSDLDSEKSLTTWFSAVQLLAIGALLLLAARNNRQQACLSNFPLNVAGVIFIWLSADEDTQLHENLTYMARHFGLSEISFVGENGAWLIAYAVLGLLGLAFAMKHVKALWRHFNPVAVIGLAGVAVYILGAAGFEIASFPLRNSEATRTLHLLTVLFEEFFEMVGVSIILYATLLLANRVSTPREPQPAVAKL